MKSFVLLTVFFAVTHAAPIGTDERLALLLKYGADCANKTGVSVSALIQQTPPKNDPAYNDYLTCFYGKYFSENTPTENSTVSLERIQNFPVIVSYAKECAAESEISLKALLKIADLSPPENNPAYKKYILCYLLKLGVLNEEGDVPDDTVQIEKWLPSRLAKIVLDSAKTNCGNQKGETLEDTAVLLFRCFMKQSKTKQFFEN